MFWNKEKKVVNKTSLDKTDKQPVDIEQPSSLTIKKIPIKFLKRLVPIGRLAEDVLKDLKLGVSSHLPGEVVFKINEQSNSVPYLIQGECYVEAGNGSGYLVSKATMKALFPLNNSSVFQCTVTAKSDIKILHFPTNILNSSRQHARKPLVNKEDIPESLINSDFFNTFCRCFKEEKLTIPCLPDVALKLRAAIQKNIGVEEAVKIINFDSVISSKLIQIVNSPLYRAVNPITNCHDAVSRLGLEVTRNLVTSISLQNLYKSKNKIIAQHIHKQWVKSIQIASISYTLAKETGKVNPDEALLMGLTHNIGALPILIFADGLADNEYSNEELEQTIFTLQGVIGSLILNSWDFPEHLQKTPEKVEGWFSNNQEELDISDIVLLAKFHSWLGSNQQQKLPPIHTLPAFQKLGENQLTPDLSLKTLQDAKQQIAQTMSLFK